MYLLQIINVSHCERKMRTNLHLRAEYFSSLRVMFALMAVYEYKSALRDVTGFYTTRHMFLLRIYIFVLTKYTRFAVEFYSVFCKKNASLRFTGNFLLPNIK